jgi:maltose alpha-D-glucosyltransferase/alpha-amylase
MADRGFGWLSKGSRAPADAPAIADLLSRREELESLITSLSEAPPRAVKIRIHGDYHLAQVLIAKDDVFIVDFEGEPARSEEKRRAKASPLRDVAGMLRSFEYVEETVLRDIGQRLGEASAKLRNAAADWRRGAEERFLAAYHGTLVGSALEIADGDASRRHLRLHRLARALYEIEYEAGNRPEWVDIPVRGVIAILDEAEKPR